VNQNDHLIERATAALNPRRVGDRLFGDVACALVTDAGSWYVGVCIDTASGTGFCRTRRHRSHGDRGRVPHRQDRRCLAR
jgi:hypothetical protein